MVQEFKNPKALILEKDNEVGLCLSLVPTLQIIFCLKSNWAVVFFRNERVKDEFMAKVPELARIHWSERSKDHYPDLVNMRCFVYDFCPLQGEFEGHNLGSTTLASEAVIYGIEGFQGDFEAFVKAVIPPLLPD